MRCRFRYGVLLASVVLAVSTGLAPALYGTADAAVSAAGGKDTPQTLDSISCPSVSTCFAVGANGTIIATHDSGHTWQRQVSGTSGYLAHIDCPSARTCFVPNIADSNSLLVTTDGGTTWTHTSYPGGGALSCPNVTTCLSIGNGVDARTGQQTGELFVTTDSGYHWTVGGALPSGPSNQYDLGSGHLACPTVSTCYIGGSDALASTSDGGKTWQVKSFTTDQCPDPESVCRAFSAGIACPSASMCLAAGIFAGGGAGSGVVAETVDAGRSWQLHVIPALTGLRSLSCPFTTECFTLDSAGRTATTTDGGRTWQVGAISTPIPYPFYALNCPGTAECFAAGFLGRVMGTVNGGVTWRDLLPAIFLYSTWGIGSPHLHLYSRWFTAAHPWSLTFGVDVNDIGGGSLCYNTTIDLYAQNAAKKRVTGPIRVRLHSEAQWQTGRNMKVSGKLRLEVVSARCPSFAVRVDGVQ